MYKLVMIKSSENFDLIGVKLAKQIRRRHYDPEIIKNLAFLQPFQYFPGSVTY